MQSETESIQLSHLYRLFNWVLSIAIALSLMDVTWERTINSVPIGGSPTFTNTLLFVLLLGMNRCLFLLENKQAQ